MSRMFFGCSSLKEINLSNFNTDNVNDMSCMFYECSSLKKLIFLILILIMQFIIWMACSMDVQMK